MAETMTENGVIYPLVNVCETNSQAAYVARKLRKQGYTVIRWAYKYNDRFPHKPRYAVYARKNN